MNLTTTCRTGAACRIPLRLENTMKIRAIISLTLIALGLGGCHSHAPVRHSHTEPPPHAPRAGEEMYEGYFYARIIYINNMPYHVDDDRRAHPIPRHLHPHFRERARHHRVFGWRQVAGSREGYHLARIVYLNGIPHYVEDDRRAHPLPPHLRQRFDHAAAEHPDDDEMYEGYFYARIVYINGMPYHVQDDRRAYPIPRHLRKHFRQRARRHRAFGWRQQDGMRDGYRLGRIIYIDDVPHHVDDDRHARPLPPRLRPRFSYAPLRDDPPAQRSGGDDEPRSPAGRQFQSAPPPFHGARQERGYPESDDDDRHLGTAPGAPEAAPAPGRGAPATAPGGRSQEQQETDPDAREVRGPAQARERSRRDREAQRRPPSRGSSPQDARDSGRDDAKKETRDKRRLKKKRDKDDDKGEDAEAAEKRPMRPR